MAKATPIKANERLREIDMIRGFALFGVLWINLVTHGMLTVPEGTYDDLLTKPIDQFIAPIAEILFSNKAITLFSLLFGYGFAMFLNRVKLAGDNTNKIFLRRTLILFCFGIFHVLFIWFGDILHVYALMGLVLFLARNWSDKALLITGLFLALFSKVIVQVMVHQLYEEPFPWSHIYEIAPKRHFAVLQESNYIDYVGELWWGTFNAMWTTPSFIYYCLSTLGKFMIGAWIFRRGWIQNSAQFKDSLQKWAWIFITCGIALSLISYFFNDHHYSIDIFINYSSNLILAIGYGAGIIVIYQSNLLVKLMNGLASVGRLALTNYVMQSFMYIFVLFGFGLGLLDILGATLCLTITIIFFSFQIIFSIWWMQKFRFGPLEWLWRSLTYGSFQPFRK